MLKYLVKRLLKAAVTIFFILTLVFFFTRLSGDPTDWILPDDATEEQRIEMRHSLGLDKPLIEQYGDVLLSLFCHGDLLSQERVFPSVSRRNSFRAVSWEERIRPCL